MCNLLIDTGIIAGRRTPDAGRRTPDAGRRTPDALLFGPTTRAQLLPPSTAIKWDKNGDGDWATASNWAPATVPGTGSSDGADVLFGSVPDQGSVSAITVSNDETQSLKSIWFDASSGLSYTIGNPTGSLTLGVGLADGGNLVTVISNGQRVTENTIDNGIIVSGGSLYNRWIINNSRGGLRFGGRLFLGSQNLKVSGSGATYFANDIDGSGSISTVQDWVPHLILSGNNGNWSGDLNVGAETLVFVKSNGALGTGANTIASGGTLGFRSDAGTTLNYDHDDVQALQVSGPGAVRAWGQPAVGAIYHDGGGNAATGALNTFSGDIQLTGDTWFGARGDAGGLSLSGKITGTGYWLNKRGLGLITLSNVQNSGFATGIESGVLRITHDNAISGNLRFSGGILELGSGNFARTLGSGTDQVRWGDANISALSTSGGFSAYGGGRTVSLLDAQGDLALLTWGQSDFLQAGDTLLLSSRYADSLIDFRNSIDLSGANREIRVERGYSGANDYAHAAISGDIIGTGNSGILKTGSGLLDLTGTDNTYSGSTIIREGVLTGNISANSNIQLQGGVLGLNADFTASRGEGAGQIRWRWTTGGTRSGGFAAYGGDRIVKINNSTTSIAWNTLFSNGYALRFGHYTATGTVIWDKQLNLGTNQTRTIHVERGDANKTNNHADVRFNQSLSGTRGTLNIRGDGRMDIAVDNSSLRLNTINLYGAELRLHGEGSINAQSSQVITQYIIFSGGTLTLDNSETYNSNRIHNNSIIRITRGSTLRYVGQSSGTSQETIGNLYSGTNAASTIDLQHISTGVSDFTELRGTFLWRGTYALLNYTTHTEDFTKVRLSFTDGIDETSGGITPWATVNGKDWGSAYENNGVTELRPYGNYSTDGQGNWSAAHNVHMADSQTLDGNRIINSLKLGNTTLDLGGKELILNSAGLLTTTGDPTIKGAADSIIKRAGENAHLYLHVYSNTLNVAGNVSLDGLKVMKTGPGTLTLNSNAIHTPNFFYIYQGTVELQQGVMRSQIIRIGDGAGRDILILPKNSTDVLRNVAGTGSPDVWLHGTPYGLDPSNVYGGAESDQAILRLSGNTKQHIRELTILDRGTIDFAGGDAALANILWLERLSFTAGSLSSAEGRLFIRNWYQYEDYLLISRAWLNGQSPTQRAELLSQIIFDGYQDFPVLAIDYDSQYYQITPFHAPEPATYGAILGAVGVGLIVWRTKRRHAASVK